MNDLKRAVASALSGLTTTPEMQENLIRTAMASQPRKRTKESTATNRVKLKLNFSLSFGLPHLVVAAIVIIVVMTLPLFLPGQRAIFKSWQSENDEHYILQGFEGEKNPQVAEAEYRPAEFGNFSVQSLDEALHYYGPGLPVPAWTPDRFSVLTYEISVLEEMRTCMILYISEDGTLLYQVTDYFDPTSAYSYIEQDGEGEHFTLPDGRKVYLTTNAQRFTATWSVNSEHVVISGDFTREEAIRMAESVKVP